jgi:coenzyme F420-0:L-glutamate ligase/coenzyme F420-1:gamma-L-glutamate ligase
MTIEVIPVTGLPEIDPHHDLGALIAEHMRLEHGDVVVVAQKVVSKAEGRIVAIDPERRAEERARIVSAEAVEIVARRGNLVIARTRHGFVCAHAGVDASNVPADRLVLLPLDPDASAARIRARIAAVAGVEVAVIVSDTFGRPWRVGQTNVALGVAGLAPVRDHRGEIDSFETVLEATEIAVADELAGAAELVMRKSDGIPVAVVRGYDEHGEPGRGRDLIRPPAEDLFPTGIVEDA